MIYRVDRCIFSHDQAFVRENKNTTGNHILEYEQMKGRKDIKDLIIMIIISLWSIVVLLIRQFDINLTVRNHLELP